MAKPGLYYLWGEEAYRIDQEIEDIVRRWQSEWGQEPELVFIDSSDLNPQQLIESLEFSPLFALQRIVVIKRPEFLTKGSRQTSRLRDFQTILENYIQQMPIGQILILTSDERNATNPLVKLLEKHGQVVPCPRLSEKELTVWVEKQFADLGRKAHARLINRLVRSGQDMYYLKNLIDKLCLMYPDRTIPESCWEGQMETREEIKIFGMIDGMTARNPQKALHGYHHLRSQGDENIPMLALINRQFQTLATVKYYQEKGLSREEIVKTTGQKDYPVRKMMEITRNFSWESLENIFALLLETDVGLKSTSQDPDLLMEMLLVSCCETKVPLHRKSRI
jgi:DNA polymerase-3 subunit delta